MTKKIETYVLYMVQGFEDFNPAIDKMADYVEIRVVASNENEALEKAQRLIKRKQYRIANATEYVITK